MNDFAGWESALSPPPIGLPLLVLVEDRQEATAAANTLAEIAFRVGAIDQRMKFRYFVDAENPRLARLYQ